MLNSLRNKIVLVVVIGLLGGSVGYFILAYRHYARERDSVVILATGQSNMANLAVFRFEPSNNLKRWDLYMLEENLRSTDEDKGNQFEQPAANETNLPTVIADVFARKYPDKTVYLISLAWGGKPITHWTGEFSSPNVMKLIEANVPAALQTIDIGHVDYFFWWQGESDTAFSAEEYTAQYHVLESRLKTHAWFNEDGWFNGATKQVLFGLNSNAQGAPADYDKISGALKSIVLTDAGNKYFIPTNDLTFSDGTHLDATSWPVLADRVIRFLPAD